MYRDAVAAVVCVAVDPASLDQIRAELVLRRRARTADAVARIGESLAALGRGEPGADLATVRQDLARRRAGGA